MAIKPKTLYKLTSTSEELTSENYLTTTEEIDLTKYKSFEGVNRGGSSLLALCHFDEDGSMHSIADEINGYWSLSYGANNDGNDFNNVITYTTDKKFGKASLKGTANGLRQVSKHIRGFDCTKEFTISFWANLGNVSKNATPLVFMGTSYSNYAMRKGIYLGTNAVGAGSSYTTLSDGTTDTASKAFYPATGTWAHYEISRSSNNVFFFIDGKLKFTAISTTEDMTCDSGYTDYLCMNNGLLLAAASIDELKVYNYCKHTTDFTPETSAEYIGKTAYLKDNKLYGIDSTDAMVVLSEDFAAETDVVTVLNKVTREAYKSELTTLSTFSIINYSIDKEATYAIQAIPKPLLLTPKALNDDSLVNTYGTWSTTYTVSGSGVIKYALTNDLSTYFIYSGNTWPTVDATTADKALSSFESIQTLAAYQMQKAKFSTGKSAIAFVLDITYLSDVATIDTVKDNETVKEHWVDTNEFSSSYVNNNELDLTITGTGNYLVDWNKNEDIDIDSNGGLATEDDILNMFNEG
jgi:hypothetical protein